MTINYPIENIPEPDSPGWNRTPHGAGARDASTVMIALSHHRCEMIPLAVNRMRRCDIVILEEPPDDDFLTMLKGEVSIDEYVLGIDTEYPEFSRRMGQALRGLDREGIRILQIEPYLERLLEIHHRLGDGARPADLEADTSLWAVYDMERRATRALIDFYEASSQCDFDAMLNTVKAFAKVDARRFVMRDRLRARSIAKAVVPGRRIYVEAGQMHVGLGRSLRQYLPVHHRVEALYLTPETAFPQSLPVSHFGPGDILTLIYTFNPDFDNPMADLWAARALIQNKIIMKNEITDVAEAFPHTRDEVETSRLVRELDLDMCRHLVPLIDKMTFAEARHAVKTVVLAGNTRDPVRASQSVQSAI